MLAAFVAICGTAVWLIPKPEYDVECAVVAKIDRTYDVVVCVRGIKQRYPEGQQRIPGNGFDA